MRKNGFTLIELLAVIVILAIIALIATPLILNVIDDAKKGAFQNSAYGIVSAAELGYAKDVLNNEATETTFTYENGVEVANPSGKKLDYKGSRPQNGTVVVNSDGDVAIAIHDGKYCAEKNYTDSAVVVSEKTVGECVITAPSVVNADASGASMPELTTGMIAVKWDGTNWIKADTNNVAGANQWYDYNAKMWANAVTVTSANRSTYQSAAVGTVISMSDINTMWVWIPRYKYAIPTGTGAREINVVFEAKDVTKSTGTAVDTDYLTHPAFTFGTTEVDGIWAGKFETTGDLTSPTIIPNTTSLVMQTVKSMHDWSRTMENNTTYGTGADGDIHMMKDSEWGAVAYLSNSQYGINEEVYKNNSSSYYTGRSGGNAGGSQVKVGSFEYINTGFYTYDGKCATTTTLAPGIDGNCTTVGNDMSDKTLAYKASTTGTIYGVYDMSGGAYEHTMGMYRPNDTTSVTDNSGFGATTTLGSLPTSEYWNQYLTTDVATACNNGICYGSALSETSGWYSDLGMLGGATSPWTIRGGFYSNTTNVGIFNYITTNGSAATNQTFRIVQIKP